MARPRGTPYWKGYPVLKEGRQHLTTVWWNPEELQPVIDYARTHNLSMAEAVRSLCMRTLAPLPKART